MKTTKDEALDLALERAVPSILSPGWVMIPDKDFDAIKQALAAPTVRDAEGENKAVRSFLMLYGQRGVTVGGMKRHMGMSGFKSWPAWVDTEPEGAHLTKAGAQLWIRHLFALEATPPAQPAIPDAITDNSESPEYRAGWNECRELTIQMRKS
jgi:hypothetical protein